MNGEHAKSFDEPDERMSFPGISEDIVEIGDLTIGRVVTEPGWRWSTHMRPIVGGEWCEARHVGMILSGRMGVLLRDGATFEAGPFGVYDIPPGHDGYTIGDQPTVSIEWSGLRAFAGGRGRFNDRILTTLLFTDLVESTATAARVGDPMWKELLSHHYAGARAELERYGGREVSTTGDGLLAMFDGPAAALHCASAIRMAAIRQGLHIRAGVHVGEVQSAGATVQGLAVHEAARVMGAAGTDEILVSETTRALAAGLPFEDRGMHQLKGLPDERRLFAYVG